MDAQGRIVPTFVDDGEIDQLGDALELACAKLISECMAAEPFYLNWPIALTDVPPNAHYADCAQGEWQYLRRKSAELGGGTILMFDGDDREEPLLYAHCVKCNEEIIEEFRLNDPRLIQHAEVGDLLLTFAGLHEKVRGARFEPNTGEYYPRPAGGWPKDQPKPGQSMYSWVYTERINRWANGKRVWNRTHPSCWAVVTVAHEHNLHTVGTIRVQQAGSPQPKTVLASS